MSDYELYHHGVKGMKWGVRRTEAQLARIAKKSSREKWSSDATEAAKLKVKKPKQMSNSELRKLNERTRLEREHSQLHPSAINRGMRFVVGAAVVMGSAVSIYNSANSITKIGKKGALTALDALANRAREASSRDGIYYEPMMDDQFVSLRKKFE